MCSVPNEFSWMEIKAIIRICKVIFAHFLKNILLLFWTQLYISVPDILISFCLIMALCPFEVTIISNHQQLYQNYIFKWGEGIRGELSVYLGEKVTLLFVPQWVEKTWLLRSLFCSDSSLSLLSLQTNH